MRAEIWSLIINGLRSRKTSMENVNWDVFTEDERKGIKKLIDMRLPQHFTSIILNMDKAKELELQKIVAQHRPLNDTNENQIRDKVIENYYKTNPHGPQSPAEEKVLQDELDEELRKFHEKQQNKASEQVELLENKEKVVEEAPLVVENTTGEAPFCTQCDSKGVRHKKVCPTNLNKQE